MHVPDPLLITAIVTAAGFLLKKLLDFERLSQKVVDLEAKEGIRQIAEKVSELEAKLERRRKKKS
jgi:hypothetical protein